MFLNPQIKKDFQLCALTNFAFQPYSAYIGYSRTGPENRSIKGCPDSKFYFGTAQ